MSVWAYAVSGFLSAYSVRVSLPDLDMAVIRPIRRIPTIIKNTMALNFEFPNNSLIDKRIPFFDVFEKKAVTVQAAPLFHPSPLVSLILLG